MSGEGRDPRIVQRGIDEAYACRDRLTPAPERPSLVALAMARVGSALRAVRAALVSSRPRRRPLSGSVTESIR